MLVPVCAEPSVQASAPNTTPIQLTNEKFGGSRRTGYAEGIVPKHFSELGEDMRVFQVLCAIVLMTIASLSGALAQDGDQPVIRTDPPVTVSSESCKDRSGRELSSEFLRRIAHCLYEGKAADRKRLALVDDLYIKSWSYSILNKGFFWASVGLAVTVLMWPAMGPIFGRTPNAQGEAVAPPNRFQRAIAAPAVQTSITALAAFSFAFYAHYKEKQSVAETLMRQVIFSDTLDQEQIDTVVERLSEMDRGFGFATSSLDISDE